MTAIPGLHHVTAISGPPQVNVDFFTGLMGQRLVKKTVNFDAPDTYHLYYGDAAGTPGTILTFFPFVNAAPGRPGPGTATAYAYGVPKGGIDRWVQRLASAGIAHEGTADRFGARVITLRDPDGAPVELIETDLAVGGTTTGFHSVTLWVRDPGPTARILTDVFGYAEAGSESDGTTERLRLKAPGDALGNIVDIVRAPATAAPRQGRGSIHHIAFRAPTDDDQRGWMEKLAQIGYPTTPVIDRQYFNAVYFREPGGVLFEIATDAPGFDVDEPAATMGTRLMLPAQHEPLRARIERVLPPLTVA